MKLPTKLFLVVLFAGVAVGNEEGSAKSDITERACPPIVAEHVPLPTYVKFHEVLKSCGETVIHVTYKFNRDNLTASEIQETFDLLCPLQAEFRACLAEQAANMEVCQNPTMLNFYNIDRDFVTKSFDYFCADGAKRGVTLANWALNTPKTSAAKSKVEECGLKMVAVWKPLDKSAVDDSSKTFIFHQSLIKFAECMNQIDNFLPSEVFGPFPNEVLATLKCIHPQDGTLVPCASISVDQLSASTICKVMTHGSKLDIHDILENKAGRCFDIMDLDAREEDITSNNEALREEIKEFCIRKKKPSECLIEQTVISDICHNETQKNEFNLLVESVKKGWDAACLEDGKRLADVMFEVYRLKKTGNGNAVWDCIDSAKATRNELDVHTSSSKNMRFYHELETFKGCLVNKLGDDVTSVAAATSLIDEMLKVIECVNVTDKTTVTCESLMHHHH